MKLSTLAIAVALGGLSTSGAALADKNDDDLVIKDSFTVRTDTQKSGSGHTILDNCGPSSGNQTASLNISQSGNGSKVEIEVEDAAPNTAYTVWVRMKGNVTETGHTIGGNPMNGGGAAPLAPGSAIDDMLDYTSPLQGSDSLANGFVTDANGDAEFEVNLDYPVFGGAYPFHKASAAAIADYVADSLNPKPLPLINIPSPIVDPTDPNISAGFLIRVVSHCVDQVGHGIVPGSPREAWFQYP